MLGIKKLDIFIAKQFGLLCMATFFICQFVLMMQFLWRYVEDLIGKGLTLDVLAQFFWWMGLSLMPQAFPLAILLSSLITFGNLGESSELTAIKAAGISLMQAFRPLIVITILIAIGSFLFQNEVTPRANKKLAQLIISMKQKSPELEIPEGVFYDGIPNCNLYVQEKDLNTGMLYGIMIYRKTGSYEDQAIILADSGQLQSTEEKKHLILKLYHGEWFENMRSQELAGNASVPYRRETFTFKNIVLDFDGNFNMASEDIFANNAKAKSLRQLRDGIDSLTQVYDSVGHIFYTGAMTTVYKKPELSKKDSLAALKQSVAQKINRDTVLINLDEERQERVYNEALNAARMVMSDLEFKAMQMFSADRVIREHQAETWNKFTLALSCVIFFFIGAPLGAIIRKGGLGVPVIISVLVFIIYYILDNTGFRMSRLGEWAIWFGKSLATVVLAPVAAFFTYKANNDSVVFNMEMYRDFFRKLFGLRLHRHVYRKEVIINDPQYRRDAESLAQISTEVKEYDKEKKLYTMPNVIDVFFKYTPDHKIEEISERLEEVIEDLSNTRDKQVLTLLNQYPVLSVKAHTRPFEYKWANIISAIIVPLGVFFFFRMWRFRLRLFRDLKVIEATNEKMIERINQIEN